MSDPGNEQEPQEQPEPQRQPDPQPEQPEQPEQPAGGGGGGGGGNGNGGDGQSSAGKTDPPGPGSAPATKRQMAWIGGLLVSAMLLVFLLLIHFWPHPTPSLASTGPTPGSAPQADSVRADSIRAAAIRAHTDSIRADSARADSLGALADSLRADSLRVRIANLRARIDSLRTDSARIDSLRRNSAGASGRARPRTVRADSATSEQAICEAREDELRTTWAAERKPAPAACIWLPWGHRLLWGETRLLILVLLAGALGGLVHSLRSFVWYIGNRELVRSWLPYYGAHSIVGAGISFVFYVLVRGNFFSPGTSIEGTSPFGFVAFGLLVGMFSEQAVLKLKTITEEILAKPTPGRDTAPQQHTAGPAIPSIGSVTREGATNVFSIKGTGFSSGTEVFVNGEKQTVEHVNLTQMRFTLAQVVEGSKLSIEVRNPGGTKVATDFTVPPAT